MNSPLIDRFMRDAIQSGTNVRVYVIGTAGSSVRLIGRVLEFDGVALLLEADGNQTTVRVDAVTSFALNHPTTRGAFAPRPA